MRKMMWILGSLPRQTGRCAPPRPSQLLIRPPKIFTTWYRTLAAYVKGFFLSTHCKKGERFSRPQPGCHWLNSLWAGIIELFPSRESLISDIPAGDGKMANLFLQCRGYEIWGPLPRPAHRSFADPSVNIFGVNLCFFLYFNCLLYHRHAYYWYSHIRHSEGFSRGPSLFWSIWGQN